MKGGKGRFMKWLVDGVRMGRRLADINVMIRWDFSSRETGLKTNFGSPDAHGLTPNCNHLTLPFRLRC